MVIDTPQILLKCFIFILDIICAMPPPPLTYLSQIKVPVPETPYSKAQREDTSALGLVLLVSVGPSLSGIIIPPFSLCKVLLITHDRALISLFLALPNKHW